MSVVDARRHRRGPRWPHWPDHRRSAQEPADRRRRQRAIVSGRRTAGDGSRAARSGSAARRAHAAPRPIASAQPATTLPYVRGSIIVKFKDDATARRRSAAATAQVSGDDRRSIVVGRLRHRRHSRRRRSGSRRGGDARAAGCRIRAAALSQPRDGAAQRHALRATSGTSPPSTWSARGTSSPARPRTSSSPCSTAAWRFATVTMRYNSRFAFRVTPNGPLYPALGVVDVPFAAAPELGPSGSTRFVSPRDFIWNDELPVDLDGARHARRRHHRTAHQQRQRHRRHGLQRAADAGEGHPGLVGRDLRQSRSRAPTMSWRAASATRPTTARR